VAERREDGLLYYIAESLKPYSKRGMESDRATDIKNFGFEFEENDDSFFFRQTEPSTAKYADGVKREWQGKPEFIIKK
jgi:hypothetical protein